MSWHHWARVVFEGGSSPIKETTTPTLTRVELDDEFDGNEELKRVELSKEELDEEFKEGTKTAEIWGM
jgi:hypothetical protein